MTATDALLDAITNIGEKLDRKSEADEKRFARLEKGQEELFAEHVRLSRKVDKNLEEFSESLGRCASAAARAANIALEAQQRASTSVDETTKAVESALRIHRDAVNASVSAAVTELVKPIVDKIQALETSDLSQRTTLEHLEKNDVQQLAMLKTITDAVATPRVRKLLALGVFLGAVIGGYFAGASSGTSKKPTATTQAP